MTTATFRSFESLDRLAAAAAERIVDGITEAATARRPYLLGCPGGRTPAPIYNALARQCARDNIDCSHVVIVMMDDYIERDVVPIRVVGSHEGHSCRRFAEHDIRGVVNAALPTGRQISATSVWFPDPADPARYDQRIADAGGVDLFLTASGASDGHVAFCGPGADIDGTSSVVELAATTRIDNMVTFPSLTSIDAVPTHGVSVGLGTIRTLSRSVILVLHGADKRDSFNRVSGTDRFEPDWPATFIHACANAEVWYDANATDHRRST